MADIPEILDQAQRIAMQHKEMMAGDTLETIEAMVDAFDRPDVINLVAPVVGSKQRTVELLSALHKFIELEKFIRDQNVEDNVVQFIMKARQQRMLLRLLDTII